MGQGPKQSNKDTPPVDAASHDNSLKSWYDGVSSISTHGTQIEEVTKWNTIS